MKYVPSYDHTFLASFASSLHDEPIDQPTTFTSTNLPTDKEEDAAAKAGGGGVGSGRAGLGEDLDFDQLPGAARSRNKVPSLTSIFGGSGTSGNVVDDSNPYR